jgi:hypothetical protein
MKKHLSSLSSLGILSAAALALQTGVAMAQFNPVTLTQGSYAFQMVVRSNYLPSVGEYAVWVGSGFNQTDTTYYEQGLYSRKPSDYGGNSGVPIHNTVFTSINDPNITFQMPPSYLTNDDLIITSGGFGTNATGTMTLATPTTASHIALLAAGGNGGAVFNYSVNHVSGPPDTGNYAVPDWFAGGPSAAWGCDGRINTGGFANLGLFKENKNPPYLNTLEIKVSSASPVTSVDLSWNSGGGVDNFFALSVSTDGVTYVPAALTQDSFKYETIVAANVPFPVTATMDDGTNLDDDPGTTWFEAGYDTANPGDGLPPSGSSFTSSANPSDTYQMGNYDTNDAVMIDSAHLSANITPATPAAYTGLAFLTGGGDIGGGNIMSNTCVVQHKDGVNETNWVYGYDWFDAADSQYLAYSAGERVYIGGRYLNTGTPIGLFESFVTVTDTSDVTNIVVGYGQVPGVGARTVIMAVSGNTAPWGPLIQQGPTPGAPSLFAGETVTFTVSAVGSGTITNQWLVESAGVFVPLTDGTDANGSVISGATTTTLTIADLKAADAGTYEYIASSVNGSETSSNLTITLETGTPVKPIIDGQFPTGSFTALSGHTAVTPFSVVVDSTSTAPISYQWYSIIAGVTNPIPGANGLVDPGTTNTYGNADTVAESVYCVLSNFAGTAATSPVAISLIDSLGTETAYGTSILALKPVAYWPLDESNGIIAFDHAGNSDGTYIGGCTLGQPGIPASAAIAAGQNLSVAFDGTSGYVTIPAGNSNLNITGPITVMQWVQTPSGGESGTSAVLGHGGNSYTMYVDKTALPEFADTGPGSGGSVNDGNNINDGNWHMLVGVFDGSSVSLYVDGVAQGGTVSTETPGESIPVTIGTQADAIDTDFYAGNIAQVAIFTNVFTAAQVTAAYQAAELPPGSLTIAPANPSVYVGRNVTLAASATLGNPATSYQWYIISTDDVSNSIVGATSATYTLTDATIDMSGETIGVIAANAYGSANATTVLAVSDSAATLATDLAPTNAEAAIGTSVSYTVATGGSLPITFQWTVDGTVQSGATDSIFTFPVATGKHVIQASFTNSLSGGTPVPTSPVNLLGVATTPTITFNTTGVDWATNSAMLEVPFFTNENTLELCDGIQGESSSAFYGVAQYVGSFTASFLYTLHTYAIPSGDGFTFTIQNSPQGSNAVGTDMGYSGIANSLALEANFWDYDTYLVNAVGITLETNGITYEQPTVGAGNPYAPTDDISMDSGDPIQFTVSYSSSTGMLSVNLVDQSTSDTYTTNYNVGSLIPILGANLAYVGVSASDVNARSIIKISNFTLGPAVAPPPTGPPLTVSDVTSSSFEISWPTSFAGFTVQTATNLSGPWGAGPASTVVGSSNVVNVALPGSAPLFYRLQN